MFGYTFCFILLFYRIFFGTNTFLKEENNYKHFILCDFWSNDFFLRLGNILKT